MRERAALCAVLLCSADVVACGVDDRVLSPCGDDSGVGSGGAPPAGSGGSTIVVDGSSDGASGGSGGAAAPDGSSAGGSPEEDGGGGCTGCPPNVVVNADFDSDVVGWTAEPRSAIEWDAEDANDSERSGSIQVHNNYVEDVENRTAVGAWQCATAEAGATYELAAKVLIRVTDGSGNGHLNVGLYAGPNCEPPQLPQGGFTTKSAYRLNDWENERGTIVAPPGTGSIAIRLVAEKPLRQATLAVVFDDVRVVKK